MPKLVQQSVVLPAPLVEPVERLLGAEAAVDNLL
jgi:hypothetical protein